jgi:hypothetical protein
MGLRTSGRARRVEPAAYVGAERDPAPDYSSAFAADVADADAQSAEHWARAILEGAPRFLGWFVFIGWKVVLRLRLAPRGAAGTIAGWTLTHEATPALTTLEVGSSLVTARKVLRVDANRLTLTTYVWYQGTPGRVLWSAIAPVHHRIEPLLMTLAVSRRRAGTGDGDC